MPTGEAKKGGNAVASMIWKQLKIKGLLNGRCANEINFVFDNCSGQNKNRMVLQMLFFMVKLGICRTARAIFLIKGHTKNYCDRMFNLLKQEYRRCNCYTPGELIKIMNKHPQVTAVAIEANDFKDWDALEDVLVHKAEQILKNHVFTVRAKDSNDMMIQEFSGSDIQRQELVKKPYHNADWKSLFNLAVVPPPGLPDIKWNELYAKWGRFVPEDHKKGLKYYTNKPPASLKKSLEEHSRKAREARAKRSRGASEANNNSNNSNKRPKTQKRAIPKKKKS